MSGSMVRRADLVSRREGDEVLVLDLESQTAHCLDGDVARVWEAIEAPAGHEAIEACTGLGPDAVSAALSTLHDLGLARSATGISRRTLTRGAAVGGAVIAAGVVSIPLPAAARANSATFTFTKTSCAFLSVLSGPPMTFAIQVTSGRLTPRTTYTVTYGYTTGTAILGLGGLTLWTSSSTVSAESFTFTTDANGLIAGSNTISHTTAQPYHGGMTSITISAGANDQAVLTPPASQTVTC